MILYIVLPVVGIPVVIYPLGFPNGSVEVRERSLQRFHFPFDRADPLEDTLDPRWMTRTSSLGPRRGGEGGGEGGGGGFEGGGADEETPEKLPPPQPSAHLRQRIGDAIQMLGKLAAESASLSHGLGMRTTRPRTGSAPSQRRRQQLSGKTSSRGVGSGVRVASGRRQQRGPGSNKPPGGYYLEY